MCVFRQAWKAKNLRLCPHCGRPVERIDGCNSMVCGRDAQDKGGGNLQVREGGGGRERGSAEDKGGGNLQVLEGTETETFRSWAGQCLAVMTLSYERFSASP